MLLSDCIAEGTSGAFEAPTGLGKSLAALIPAIAHAIGGSKRVVIATYTNVLAEQYWRNDLPLALSLFEQPAPKVQFLIGRQRYACLAAMKELKASETSDFKSAAKLGIETEFRNNTRKFGREATQLWSKIVSPPVCPGRLCNEYQECYYYKARRGAERASIVITNHSVVLQDALLKKASADELSLLGDFDFLIVDEAHDFADAALNALEFDLSEPKLSQLGAISQRIQSTLQPLSIDAADPISWNNLCEEFRKAIALSQRTLQSLGQTLGHGIIKATPTEVWKHPQLQARATFANVPHAQQLATHIGGLCHEYVKDIEDLLKSWRRSGGISGVQAEDATDTIRNYCSFLKEFAVGCQMLFSADDMNYSVGVTYASGDRDKATFLRHDVIGLAEPLREILWEKVPTACMSATLATDNTFDFFKRMTGFQPMFEEQLPSPFDHGACSALYMPPAGAVSDPSTARKDGNEEVYYDQLAAQVSKIIRSMGGRTLVLFHSRREMEAVHSRLALPADYPILMQRASGVASLGERFVSDTRSSLFAVRSFWTGFDAPGETLSCVVLVRVPFEVPVDPAQVARMAWMQTQGLDPFGSYSLPQAKMMMRQGAGRLIRRADDCGVIALLDPRLRTKRYGEEILANLPLGMRTFESIEEAAAHVGIDVEVSVLKEPKKPEVVPVLFS